MDDKFINSVFNSLVKGAFSTRNFTVDEVEVKLRTLFCWTYSDPPISQYTDYGSHKRSCVNFAHSLAFFSFIAFWKVF